MESVSPAVESKKKSRPDWLFDVLLVLVLLAGAYFRLVGFDWGENQFLHPDERFLLWVGADISPTRIIETESGPQKVWLSFSEYFDTVNSSLNPNNRGHGFYVYGTLPMFMTRYIVEWVYGHSGFVEMLEIGRPLSALFDILTLFLIYIVGARLYNRRVGLLSAAFSAAVVLQIQQSHFFTMDTFVNFFTFLAFYFAARILMSGNPWKSSEDDLENRRSWKHWLKHPLLLPSLGFGLALGMGVASKLNAAPVAILLPLAVGVRWLQLSPRERMRRSLEAMVFLFLAAFVSLLVFRILQPYAFSGPGFFGLKLNPQWVANIREQRAQSNGDVDFPPAMQWARRPVWFSGQNLILWGLGLPLGLLSWFGFLWAGWRMITGRARGSQAGEPPEWQRHLLPWAWTAFYFTWQSLALNPTMRYQLPVYPTLTLFAGWAVVAAWDRGRKTQLAQDIAVITAPPGRRTAAWKVFAILGGGLALVLTYAYAYAFSQIYVRPITRVEASRWIYQNIPGPVNLRIQTAEGVFNQPISFPYEGHLRPSQPYQTAYTAKKTGILREIDLPHVNDLAMDGVSRKLVLDISVGVEGEAVNSTASVTADFSASGDPRGDAYTFKLEPALQVLEGQPVLLRFELQGDALGPGNLVLQGASIANEGEWDDGLPLRVDGYDGFGGIYPIDLNFNMYWEDNPEKYNRFVRILNASDYIVITSNRQWGSLTRIPERFPMTTIYYRELLGCPPEEDIVWCYRVARPGTFQGRLGYDLVQTFQSEPSLGSVSLNDQFAEEAFTVYDHPKVFLFKKNESYSSLFTASTLGVVDWARVIHIAPLKFPDHPANLLLPLERWTEQQAGGTWAKLFNTDTLQNRSQGFAVILWYLSLTLLGLLAYPLVRIALPGLPDGGYPLARTVGMLLLSYIVWLAGSARIPFTRPTILAALLLIAALSATLAYRQRDELRREWKTRKGYFLSVEMVVLAFFLLDLLIRWANPDLWHPWKGGERPMDFSYFNAVLKSTSFPPYDPWYAGGYLNYYYYGFVLVGVLVKALGIVPAVAYNLILPTIFALIAIGAFSLAWNFASCCMGRFRPNVSQETNAADQSSPSLSPFWVGLSGALGMALLGNLGTVRMIYHGYIRIAAPGIQPYEISLPTRLVLAFQGFIQAMTGASMPYILGDWYWIPSRAIPAQGDIEPITEFPFFTVLYGDPHAHLFALPLTLLVLAFALSVILARARWKSKIGAAAGIFLGALSIGVLRPTNTWDFPVYLALGALALGYSLARNYRPSRRLLDLFPPLRMLSAPALRLLAALTGVLLLAILSFMLFQPYAHWYGLGYTKIALWKGTHTPIASYLVHWGLFLFVIVAWMAWETREWMANTPLSALRRLQPHLIWLQAGGLLLLAALFGLAFLKVSIGWLALPLAAWAGLLMLRPEMPDFKRFVLFLVGTGLTLTIMVEVIVLVGDIGRMNTVFKFYLQVWTFFAISAAAALGWLLLALPKWLPNWRSVFQIMLTVLAAGAALFPLLGGVAKIKDRMTETSPHTLDGMAYMQYAHFADQWGDMDLSQDYRAIRWLQENVQGSPVIVEANLRNLYRWGSRMTIYTGLPGVVGWEWHEQQQRTLIPGSWVTERILEIDDFYLGTDLQSARAFLKKYGVQFIILGQQERGHYAGPGLEKFDAANGILWREVYREGETVIYEVIPS